MSDLCRRIADLQAKAREQARQVADRLEDPADLIAALREQMETITALQTCVKDLSTNKDGLTAPDLEQLQNTFKELVDATERNHREATRRGIRLTPKVHRPMPAAKKPGKTT